MPNRKESTFVVNLLGELATLNKATKDFLFLDGFRNARVMDPWMGLRGMQHMEVWGDDPVHIKRGLFKHLAEGVKITLDKIKGKKRSASQMDGGSNQGRTDSSGEDAGHRGGAADGVNRNSGGGGGGGH
jgi:hypothetical protein